MRRACLRGTVEALGCMTTAPRLRHDAPRAQNLKPMPKHDPSHPHLGVALTANIHPLHPVCAGTISSSLELCLSAMRPPLPRCAAQRAPSSRNS